MVLKRNGFSLWKENSIICNSVSFRRIAFCIPIDTCCKFITAVFTVRLFKQRDACTPFPQKLLVTFRKSGTGTGFSSNTFCTSGFPLTVSFQQRSFLTDAVHVILAADSVLITHSETSLSYRLNGWLSGRTA